MAFGGDLLLPAADGTPSKAESISAAAKFATACASLLPTKACITAVTSSGTASTGICVTCAPKRAALESLHAMNVVTHESYAALGLPLRPERDSRLQLLDDAADLQLFFTCRYRQVR